ncbi:hypothetical protein SDC9_184820 [bioreactor metagenome]|uniref:Uncharacterized protein n=1 Tax=bioreactor metagenome TaxID=1076179 RepID=A0A645HMG3_9ZZZZ
MWVFAFLFIKGHALQSYQRFERSLYTCPFVGFFSFVWTNGKSYIYLKRFFVNHRQKYLFVEWILKGVVFDVNEDRVNTGIPANKKRFEKIIHKLCIGHRVQPHLEDLKI